MLPYLIDVLSHCCYTPLLPYFIAALYSIYCIATFLLCLMLPDRLLSHLLLHCLNYCLTCCSITTGLVLLLTYLLLHYSLLPNPIANFPHCCLAHSWFSPLLHYPIAYLTALELMLNSFNLPLNHDSCLPIISLSPQEPLEIITCTF